MVVKFQAKQKGAGDRRSPAPKCLLQENPA